MALLAANAAEIAALKAEREALLQRIFKLPAGDLTIHAVAPHAGHGGFVSHR